MKEAYLISEVVLIKSAQILEVPRENLERSHRPLSRAGSDGGVTVGAERVTAMLPRVTIAI